eukprot:m.52365 g.52365  ORF g.52365 m.52365 type:complete len:111 (+) comp15408_c0_seq6:341-673(+)
MDAGLVTTLPDDVFNEFGDFMRAMCTRDAITMAEKLIFFHDQDARNALPRTSINRERLQADLEDIYINGKGRAREGVRVVPWQTSCLSQPSDARSARTNAPVLACRHVQQ